MNPHFIKGQMLLLRKCLISRSHRLWLHLASGLTIRSRTRVMATDRVTVRIAMKLGEELC